MINIDINLQEYCILEYIINIVIKDVVIKYNKCLVFFYIGICYFI